MSGEHHSCRLRELIRNKLSRYRLEREGAGWSIMDGQTRVRGIYLDARVADDEMRDMLADEVAAAVQWWNGMAFGALVFQAQDFMAGDPVRREQHQRAKTALETGEISWPAD